MLTQNIEPGEQVLAKIKGSGEGLVLTDKSVYLLKWGGLVGSALGVGKGMGSFDYEEIKDVILKKGLLASGLVFSLRGESKMSNIKVVVESVKNFYAGVFGGKTPLEEYIRTRIATFGRNKAGILNELLEFIKGKITS